MAIQIDHSTNSIIATGNGSIRLVDSAGNGLVLPSTPGTVGDMLTALGDGRVGWAAAPHGFSGSYTDLTNVPTLFDGRYASLTGKPTLFSGSYTDLSNKPTLFSGAYGDLTGKPAIPSNTSDLVNNSGFLTQAPVSSVAGRTGAVVLAYSDIGGTPALAAVATTGSYSDLANKPALFSGSYTDLSNRPTIPTVPTVVSAFTNDSAYITQTGARTAISATGDIHYDNTTGVISYTAPVVTGGGGATGYLYSGTITTAPTATGEDAIVIGDGSAAQSMPNAIVIGPNNKNSQIAGNVSTNVAYQTIMIGMGNVINNTANYQNNILLGQAITLSSSSTNTRSLILSTANSVTYSGSGAIAIVGGYNGNSTYNLGNSGNSFVLVGYPGSTSTAPGSNSVGVGAGVLHAGSGAVAVGTSSTAAGNNSTALGPFSSAANGWCLALGYTATTNGQVGAVAINSGKPTTNGAIAIQVPASAVTGSTAGKQQSQLIHLYGTNAAAGAYVELFADRVTAGAGSSRCVIPASSLWNFTAMVSALGTDVNNPSKTWNFNGSIFRGATAASTVMMGAASLVNSFTNNSSATTDWDCRISADTTNGSLKFEGFSNTYNTRWLVRIDTMEQTV